MSRYADPGPVHLSGVGGVCWPFWGDLGREPSRQPPPRSIPGTFSLAAGTMRFGRGAPSASRRACLPANWASRVFPVLPSCSGLTRRHPAPSPAPRTPGRRPGGGGDGEPCPGVLLRWLLSILVADTSRRRCSLGILVFQQTRHLTQTSSRVGL